MIYCTLFIDGVATSARRALPDGDGSGSGRRRRSSASSIGKKRKTSQRRSRSFKADDGASQRHSSPPHPPAPALPVDGDDGDEPPRIVFEDEYIDGASGNITLLATPYNLLEDTHEADVVLRRRMGGGKDPHCQAPPKTTFCLSYADVRSLLLTS